MKTILIPILVMPLCGFAQGFDGPSSASAPSPIPAAPSALAQANNSFATDLYGSLRAGPGNIFFSPYNISVALAMTYGGARGQTAAEMAKVLHFATPADSIAKAYGALDAQLQSEEPAGTLNVASSLWGEQDFHFLPAFLDSTQKDYAAVVQSVDFKNASEAARSAINQWVAGATQDKIQNLIAPGGVTSRTRLVLCSAIYFKGKWDSTFDPSSTQPTPFFVSPSAPVSVPMMSQRAHFQSVFLDGFGLLEMPYKGGHLSMIILLPTANDGLPGVESRLKAGALSGWLASLDHAPESDTQLSVPRFESTQSLDLSGPLKQLGMPTAFLGDGADFSGMTGKPDLFISAVVHKAYIDVDEEGTVAAAATAVEEFQATAVMPRPPAVTFTADHPFLYLIRDNSSGSILFLGRILDPR